MENDYKELYYKDYLEDWETGALDCAQCGSWYSETLRIIEEENGSIYVGYELMTCFSGVDEYEELEEFFKLDIVPDEVKNDVRDFLENM